jgi:hypothetical protein
MEVAEIIQDMRQQASFRCLHVADFLRPFDRFKRGAVCAADFRRGLDQCGCFALSEAQHAQLRSAFMIDTDRIAVNSPTARVAYAAFCELLQPKCAAPTALTHDLQRLKQLVAGAERRAACAASSGLSVERSRRTARLLRDLAGRVKAGRLAVRDCLVVFDGRAEGRIDKEHLEQVGASCLSDDESRDRDIAMELGQACKARTFPRCFSFIQFIRRRYLATMQSGSTSCASHQNMPHYMFTWHLI